LGLTRDLQIKVAKWVLIVDFILIIASLIFFNDPIGWILGLVFGGLIGILNFMELGRTLETAVTMNPRRAQAYAASKYFLRYIITGIVILISLKANYINALGTVIGLLLVKFVIISTNLFNDMEFFKNIFRRKEED
jgi:hypothetical protein